MALTDAPRRTLLRLPSIGWGAGLAAFVCVAPTLAVFAAAFAGESGGGAAAGLLQEAVLGTALLVIFAGGAATLLGAGAAWLVTLCDFPGRRAFEWLLVLPLAAPVYVLAYAYGAMTGPGGPVPIALSGLFGAGMVYALGFYPYVYLSARAAFVAQSVCAMEAARSLGANPWRVFATVAAPLAWPGIAAGAALAAMEIAADYGAAAYFGATTITTGVFRAWFAYGDPPMALRLASLLLVGAFALLALERAARGRRSFAGSARWRTMPRWRLGAVSGAAASALCLLLVGLGAIVPTAWLARLAFMHGNSALSALAAPLSASLLLASAGAAATLLLSGVIAAGARDGGGRVGLFGAAMGYAAPGAVTALGALCVFGAARQAGLIGGLGAATSIALLLWVYASRFAAAGAQPLEAGLTRVTRSMRDAARTLSGDGARRFLQVDLPMAAPSALAAALIVFVEILKELPATLILRPFNLETLAVRAHAYAADERLTQAAAPALAITLAGLAPMILLSRALSNARAGDGA